MIINNQDFAKTGGLTDEENRIYNLLNYDLLKLPEFKNQEVALSNAFHLIQVIFMWRCMIRLTDGKFWVKYDLPYTHNFKLAEPPKTSKYKKIVEDLLLFYNEFQKLETYHPYQLDDVRRGINALFEVIRSEIHGL